MIYLLNKSHSRRQFSNLAGCGVYNDVMMNYTEAH